MPASNGARYYVSFLDAFTKFTWIYVLHTKSQVSNAFKKFKVLVENQTGHKICNLQTDNAREFLALTPFLQQHGIHHRLTCPYTHQQNDYVERKHRHIVDMGLALLVHANLPLKFWVEAFISFVHIINVLPSPIIQGDTPHHKLFHTTPNYAHFKVFGCACYPNLRPYNTRKFAFRSQCCLFLGYSLHHAGYICLTANGKTIISPLRPTSIRWLLEQRLVLTNQRCISPLSLTFLIFLLLLKLLLFPRFGPLLCKNTLLCFLTTLGP